MNRTELSINIQLSLVNTWNTLSDQYAESLATRFRSKTMNPWVEHSPSKYSISSVGVGDGKHYLGIKCKGVR